MKFVSVTPSAPPPQSRNDADRNIEQLIPIETLLRERKSLAGNMEGGQVMESVKRVKTSSPKVSIKFRPQGTMLWSSQKDNVPGPGAYDEQKFGYVFKRPPKYSIPQAR